MGWFDEVTSPEHASRASSETGDGPGVVMLGEAIERARRDAAENFDPARTIYPWTRQRALPASDLWNRKPDPQSFPWPTREEPKWL